MPVILFIIDTSLSMSRRSHTGRTLLDLAKNTVENFTKLRQRDPTSRTDRYMLVTTDTPFNIKTDWRDSSNSFEIFQRELKSLQITGKTNLENAIPNAFDLLNLYRATSCIDNYGQGRLPWYVEFFSLVILITDGDVSNNESRFSLGDSQLRPWELTKEPYRWDQRLFCLNLKIGSKIEEKPTFLNKICENTGGRCYPVTHEKQLQGCLETIISKISTGIVCCFKKRIGDSTPAANDIVSKIPPETRKMVLLKTKPNTSSPLQGHWPIPEEFFPEPNNSSQRLTPRNAHPNITFVPVPKPPIVINSFPFDKYELESSPLTQNMLQLYKSNHPDYNLATSCWYCYVIGCNNTAVQPIYSDAKDYANFYKSSTKLPEPFGYLKPNTSLTVVNFYVMPYAFPRIIPMIEDLTTKMKNNPSYQWRTMFDEYIQACPVYYVKFLRQAFRAINAPPNLIHENYAKAKLSESSQTQLMQMKEEIGRQRERGPWKRRVLQLGNGEEKTESWFRKTLPLKNIIPDGK